MNVTLLSTLVIAVLSVARTARLIVWDDYPPMVWVRNHWDRRVHSGWNKLLHCAFCATPYLALGLALWTLAVRPWDTGLSDRWSADWWWLVVNGTWGLSYVAAMLVAWDQPPGDD